jgi:hypothetical protein
MKEFSDFVKYDVLGNDVYILCTDTDYGISAVAEIEGHIYYLGIVSEIVAPTYLSLNHGGFENVGLAILAWQDHSGDHLTNEEFDKVIAVNTDASSFFTEKV